MKYFAKISTSFIAAICIFTCLSGCSSTKERASILSLPGAGVKLKKPAGIELGPAGAILLDETGEIVINIAVSDAKRNVENDPAWRSVFSHEPEKISTRAISGNLYHRTRSADGGAWDGWFLVVPRGNKVLTVTAMYTGIHSEIFEQLPIYLKTITWDDTVLDPELAVGLAVNPKGFQLQQDFVGSLSYKATDGREFLVQPMPVTKAQSTLDKFKDFCDSMGDALGGKPVSGPYFTERQGLHTCEVWNQSEQPDMHYVALVRLPSGALFNAMGIAKANRFKSTLPLYRAAVRELKIIPRGE